MTFSQSSLDKLNTCDEQLQRLFNEVIKHRDCTILCGNRNKEDQETAFNTGHSKAHYGQSNHNFFPSCAVDVMPFPIDWGDIPRIKEFAHFVMGTAVGMGISIRWGGDFKTLVDMPHYELTDTSHAKLP